MPSPTDSIASWAPWPEMVAKLPRHWTAQPAALAGTGGYRHFALLGEQGRGDARAARLEAVLDRGVRLLVPLRQLLEHRVWGC